MGECDGTGDEGTWQGRDTLLASLASTEGLTGAGPLTLGFHFSRAQLGLQGEARGSLAGAWIRTPGPSSHGRLRYMSGGQTWVWLLDSGSGQSLVYQVREWSGTLAPAFPCRMNVRSTHCVPGPRWAWGMGDEYVWGRKGGEA